MMAINCRSPLAWYRPKQNELFLAHFLFYDFRDEDGNYWVNSTKGLAMLIGNFE